MKTYSRLRLFSYWKSSCSWRIRIVLNHKGIPHQIIPVDISTKSKENLSKSFELVNPLQRVPVLSFEETEGTQRFIAESMAIAEFLEESFPVNPLLPLDPIERANTRMLCEHISSNIQPYQRNNVTDYVKESLKGNPKEFASHFIKEGLEYIEKIITSHKGGYCVGDHLTMADVFLIPQLNNSRLMGVDLSKFGKILAIEEKTKQLKAFIDALPSNQPEAVIGVKPNKAS